MPDKIKFCKKCHKRIVKGITKPIITKTYCTCINELILYDEETALSQDKILGPNGHSIVKKNKWRKLIQVTERE